jgi:L-aspartate oxidase
MYDYDERLELAPRDIVSRSIEAEMKRLSTWCVYLDLTHLSREKISEEFPTIVEKLESVGLHPHKDWIPVVPAQHYSCGGVATDLRGRSSVPGLYAAGEVARTGVHGANRLASNSLLEAIVFSTAAATDSGEGWTGTATPTTQGRAIPENDSIRIRRALQKTMTDHVGIVRRDKGLDEAIDTIRRLATEFEKLPEAPFSPHSYETTNLLRAAAWVAKGARARRTNVGLHFNEDLHST